MTAETRQYQFIESRSTTIMAVNIGIAVIAAGILLLFNGMIAGLVALTAGGIQLSVSGLFKRRGWQGALQYKQWAAFRRFLRDFSRLEEAPVASMAIWEHYLVYAVPLGVAKEVIEQLKVLLPRTNEDRLYAGPVWLHSDRGIVGIEGIESLNTAFSSMAGAAASAMSSGSGGGGGFSGGGGGGAG